MNAQNHRLTAVVRVPVATLNGYWYWGKSRPRLDF